MIRGSTPTLTFTLPFDGGIIASLYITFAQRGKEVLTLTEKDCALEGMTITTKLSQAQTLKFDHSCPLEIQMRILTTDGNALASNIIPCSVERILKDGEI